MTIGEVSVISLLFFILSWFLKGNNNASLELWWQSAISLLLVTFIHFYVEPHNRGRFVLPHASCFLFLLASNSHNYNEFQHKNA